LAWLLLGFVYWMGHWGIVWMKWNVPPTYTNIPPHLTVHLPHPTSHPHPTQCPDARSNIQPRVACGGVHGCCRGFCMCWMGYWALCGVWMRCGMWTVGYIWDCGIAMGCGRWAGMGWWFALVLRVVLGMGLVWFCIEWDIGALCGVWMRCGMWTVGYGFVI